MNRHLFLRCMTLIILLAGMWLPGNIALAGEGTPTVAPVLTGGDSNQIQVAVQVRDVGNLGAFDLGLDAVGAILRIQSGALGNFLAGSGRQAYPLGPEVKFDGTTLLAGAYTTGDPPGAEGAGSLLNATVAVQGDGIGYLVLSRAVLGTPDAQPIPAERVVAQVQAQTLQAGWNLISVCPELGDQGLDDALGTVQGRYNAVRDADNRALGQLVGGAGAWVRVTAGDPVRLVTLGPARRPTAPVLLDSGWQMVAYCGEGALDLAAALAGIQGRYDRAIGLRGAYDTGLGAAYQTLTTLYPGDAILLHMTGSATLTFPETGDRDRPRQQPRAECPQVAPTPTMTLLYGQVTQNGAPAPAGTLVQALDGAGRVVGCAAVDQEGRFGLMAAYGADPDAGIPGYQNGQTVRLRVGSCEQDAGFAWTDDKTPHRVDVALDGQACQVSGQGYRLFLPLTHKGNRAGRVAPGAHSEGQLFLPLVRR